MIKAVRKIKILQHQQGLNNKTCLGNVLRCCYFVVVRRRKSRSEIDKYKITSGMEVHFYLCIQKVKIENQQKSNVRQKQKIKTKTVVWNWSIQFAGSYLFWPAPKVLHNHTEDVLAKKEMPKRNKTVHTKIQLRKSERWKGEASSISCRVGRNEK